MTSSAGCSAAANELDEEEVESAAQLRNRVQSGLLRTVARLAERPPMPRTVMLLYLLLDILQLLIIPLSPSVAMPWGSSPIMGSVYKFLLYINLLPRSAATSIPGLPYPYPALDLSVASIVLCSIVTNAFLYMWLSDAFSPPGTPQSAWKARIVWYLVPVFMHALLVPMVAGLLAPLSCASLSSASWMGSDLACWSGGHIGLVIAGVVVCVAFLAVMLILAVTIVDRRVEVSGKENPGCAVHGRVDAGMVLLRSALAAFYIFGFAATPWATVIVSIVAGLAYIVAYGVWFPYYRLHVNQSFAVGGSVMLSAGIAAALAVGTASSDDSNSGAILFLFLIIPCGFCAYSSILLRWKSFASLTDLSTPYLVELKARTLIIDVVEPAKRFQAMGRAAYGGRNGGLRTPGHKTGNGSGDDASVASGKARFSIGRQAQYSAVPPRDRGGDDDQSVRSGMSEKQGAASASGGARSAHSSAAPGARGRYTADGEDVEAAAAGANGVATVGDAFRLIDALYCDASRSMNGGAMLDIFAASYLGGVRHNRHLERLHLKSALAKAGTWALDVRAFAFMREEAIIAREADDSTSRMTVQKRIELEELTELSRQQVNAARTLVLSFWEGLSVRTPDLAKLQKTGAAINKALAETDASFKRLMVLAPQSPSLLRAYAEYLLELANDSRKGMELINDAEQIEDEQSRARTAAANDDVDFILGAAIDLDLSADSVAMIRVSAEPDNLGEVLGINAPAQKLLGFSAREITGRNVDIVLPSPIAEIHNSFLQRYLADGKERFVGSSRAMFMQHRSGHLVPCKGNIAKSLTGDEWFTCAEEITSNWMFLIFLGEDSAWRVTGACKGAMATMGIEGPAIKSGSVSLQNYVGDIEDLMAQFEVNADKSVLVRLLVPMADPAASGHKAMISAAGVTAATPSSGGPWRGHKASGHAHSHEGSGVANRHGGLQLPSASASTAGVLVAARAQPFAVTGLDAPFFILRFRRATAADRSLMALDAAVAGQPSGIAGEEGANTRNAIGSFRSQASALAASAAGEALRSPSGGNKHVSFGEQRGRAAATSSAAWSGMGGDRAGAGAGSDDESASDGGLGDGSPLLRPQARPPTPPSGRKGAASSSRSGAGGMPAGHPMGGDISLCPVMGGGGAARSGRSSGRTGEAAHWQAARSGRLDPSTSTPAPSSATGGTIINPSASAGSFGGGGVIDLGADIFGPVSTSVSLPGAVVSSAASVTSNGGGSDTGAQGISESVPPLAGQLNGRRGSAGLSGAVQTSGSLSDPRTPLAPVLPADKTTGITTERHAAGYSTLRASLQTPLSRTATAESCKESKAGQLTLAGKRSHGSLTGSHPAAVLPMSSSDDALTGGDAEALMVTETDGELAVAATTTGSTQAGGALVMARGSTGSLRRKSITLAGDMPGSGGSGSPSVAAAAAALSDAAGDAGDLCGIHSPKARAGGAQGNGAPTLASSPAADAQMVAAKAGSVHSGSKGSGGSGVSVSDIIRKGVHAKSKSLEGSLVVLRRSIIVAFLLIAAASIVSITVTTLLFNQMMDNMRLVQMTGERALAMQRVYSDIFALQLHAGNKSTLPNGGADTIATLTANIDTFERYHIELWKHVDGQVQAEVDLYTLPTIIKVADLTPGSFISYDNLTTTTRTLSLMNAAAEFIARARRVASMPPSAIWEGDPDAYWVVMNGRRPFRVGVNDSQLFADSRSAEQADTIDLANNIVLGVGLGILLLVAVAVITPAVFRVLNAKARIFDIFLAVPLTVTKALRARTAKRVQAAAQEDNGMDVALDLDIDDKGRGDTGEEDVGLAAVAMAANGGAVRLRGDSASVDGMSIGLHDDEDDAHSRASAARRRSSPPAELVAVGPVSADAAASSKRGRASSSGAGQGRPAATANKNKRHYARATKATCGLLVRMLWPITIYIAFFVGSYVWRAQTVEMARHARSEALYGSQLAFYIRQANMNTRSAIAYNAKAFSLDQQSRARSNLEMGTIFGDAMLYGSPALHVRRTMQLYDDVLQLWTNYACVENLGFYYTIAECEAFNSGILRKTGLLGAMQDYFGVLRAMLKYAAVNPGKPLNLNTGAPLLMNQYGTAYLSPAFAKFSSIVTEEPMRQLSQYNTLNLLLTVASIMTLLGFYAFVYSPLIRRLDRDIKNVRGLLLIFPDEVSRNTAALVNAGREMLKDSQSVAGGSVASSGRRALARRR